MSLKYLLDTNICIYIAKEKPRGVLTRFETLHIGEVGMSVITYGELMFGAYKSNYAHKALNNLEALESYIPALPIPTNCADHYGKIRNFLKEQGTPIGANDLWIAAHALALGIALVTNNEKEFSRIPDLRVENWV